MALHALWDQKEAVLRDATHLGASERLELESMIHAGRLMAEIAYAIDEMLEKSKRQRGAS